jgi:hypothetical protein
MAINIAMMAITTRSSIRVNALLDIVNSHFFYEPLFNLYTASILYQLLLERVA